MFELKKSLNVSQDNGIQLIQGLTNPDLLIEITGNETFSSGFLVERSTKKGRVFGVRWVQDSVKGQVIGIEYGSSEILLDIPDFLSGFDLEIIPNPYQFKYQVKLSERVFNPAFDVLAEKLGIPLEMIRFIPQQTLQILASINLMANTDVLGLAKAMEEFKTAQLAQSASIQSQGVTLADIKATSVVEKEFSIPKAAFVLEGTLYKALVIHDLANMLPDVTIIDASKQTQLVQVDSYELNSFKLVQTSAQWEGNDFPFTVKVQGSMGDAIPVSSGSWKKQATSDRYYRLMNGVVDRSADGVNVENPSLLSQITEAFMAGASELVYWKNSGGQTGYIDNGSLGNGPVSVSSADFDMFKNSPDSIVL